MKIIGQHGEFGWVGPRDCPYPAPKRQIEIEDNETIKIIVLDRTSGEDKDIIRYFMPGVLSLEWEREAHLPTHSEPKSITDVGCYDKDS